MNIKTMRTESEVMLVWSSCGSVNGELHMHLLFKLCVELIDKSGTEMVSEGATGA